MTTADAHAELKAKYPKAQRIYARDWMYQSAVDEKPSQVYRVEIDDAVAYGSSLEDAIAKLKFPTPEEQAKEKREAAAKLLAEADALDRPKEML